MAGHRKRTRKSGARKGGARGKKPSPVEPVSRPSRRLNHPERRARADGASAEDGEFRHQKLQGRRRRYATKKNEINARRRERYASDPEWNARCRASMQGERGHRSRLKTFYGITPADYAAMLARQNGVCGICRRPPVERRLAVDHCNATGLIRGLLCNRCNLGLGHFDHGPAQLRAASDYVHAALARAAADPAGALYVPADRPKNQKSATPWGRPAPSPAPLKLGPGGRPRPRRRR